MLKKIFTIVFAVSALSLLLAGCKKEEAADGGGAEKPAEGATK